MHPPSPGQRGCKGRGEGVIFHDKGKPNIRDLLRYSNLSNKMTISEL
jgi:hypothetical protein